MPANFMPSGVEYLRILPEIVLVTMGILVMILEALAGNRQRIAFPAITTVGLLIAFASVFVADSNAGPAFQGMLSVDAFSSFFRALVIGVGLLAVWTAGSYLRREQTEGGEFYALVLFSLSGQCFMAASNELMMVFIGLEISSIATYILSGYLRNDTRGNESALKYFLLGSFASAFLLYGIAWIYGITGSTNLTDIRQALAAGGANFPWGLVGTAAALMFVGFAFKISAAPFQIWAPDVYQGAPAPVAAFMSAGPKAAAFAILLRVYTTAFESVARQWEPMIWICALLTMVVGNFAALSQTNVKRLLAYSSIAHAGYVLIAVTANSAIGVSAAMFYLASYALMNLGAFAAVTHFARGGERYLQIEDLSGLGIRQPGTAALLALFLLSLIGVPLTAGFFGKFYIFRAAIQSDLIWLTVLGLLNSAVAAYYYLKIIVVMYMNEPGKASDTLQPPAPGIRAALWTAAAGTLIFGIFPSLLSDFVVRSPLAGK